MSTIRLFLASAYFFGKRAHAGIILSAQMEKGKLVRRVLRLCRLLSADEMTNTVHYLADYR
jgi:hypothetical protein